MRDHSLRAVSVNNNYFGSAAVPKATHNSCEVFHKIFTCLDIYGSIFSACLFKFINPAYTFQIGIYIDFDLC